MTALVLVLGAERYAVSTTQVREVVFYDTVTPVPRTPSFVRGVMNLRGQILPVVDLRARFGLEVAEPRYIVVLDLGELLVGVTVDDVEGVRDIPDSAIEPPSRMLTTVDNRFLRGIAEQGGLVMILDVHEGLLRPDELEAVLDAAEGA